MYPQMPRQSLILTGSSLSLHNDIPLREQLEKALDTSLKMPALDSDVNSLNMWWAKYGLAIASMSNWIETLP